VATKELQVGPKNTLFNALTNISFELGKIATTTSVEKEVGLKTFLYHEDYLNLTQNGEIEIELSPIQFDFLEALDDDNPDTNKYLEAVIKWGKGCIDGSSMIEDINGNKYTIEQLEKIYKNDKDFKLKIKSYNEKSKQLEEDIINDIWIKGKTDLYEVILENNKKIKVTLDHQFLTKNGWKELRELTEGDEIISYE